MSEEEVARRQNEEDLKLYGSRPEPQDLVEIDETAQLRQLPPKRDAADFNAAIEHSAKRQKQDSEDFKDQTLTAMDWSSGATPLDAWLNQSALPSVGGSNDENVPRVVEESLTAQEQEEIKVFRNVHIAMSKDSRTTRSKTDSSIEGLANLGLETQIFYRNIVDRYPLLPISLARRLARANHDRAERLRSKRLNGSKNEAKPHDAGNGLISPEQKIQPQISGISQDVNRGTRNHILYRASPKDDGLYHCAFVKTHECFHRPDKLQCNYM